MRRTKIEISLAILEVFVDYGPIRLTRVSQKAKVNYVLLKKVTKRLLTQGLVEERTAKNFVAYTATPKARLMLTRLREDAKNLEPLVEGFALTEELFTCASNGFLPLDTPNVRTLEKPTAPNSLFL